jgi:hypothetical protein
VRRHKFPSAAKALVVLGRCGESNYVDAASRRVREQGWSGTTCYVGNNRRCALETRSAAGLPPAERLVCVG